MVYTLLPALQPHDRYAIICVRVARKWKYRGPADNGDVQHIDLILVDHEANAIHAEIPRDVLQDFNNQIEEGQIYEMSRFRTGNAKTYYKPVDGCYMIQFTYHTRVSVPRKPPTGFPHYVYKLTPFEELPMLVGNIKKFLDVLGVIVQIAEPEMIQISNNHEPTITRKLVLKDANDVETKVTLWGQRATVFNIDAVYNSDEARPVVILFVGCLMKTFQSEDYLSGSSACKWYFNPEIPETQELLNRFAGQRIQIRRVTAAPQQVIHAQCPLQQETKYLQELQSIDPYEFPQNGCRCTVTIARLVPNVSWWFPSCVRCGKTCNPEGSTYRCYQCDSDNYKYKYKLLFITTDGTAEAEMICFGQIAQRIVGKSVDLVMRTIRRDEDFPPDIVGIVSQKYTFGITMTNQSYYTRNKSFMVNSTITSYGRQRAIPQVGATSSNQQPVYHRSSGLSSSTQGTIGYDQRITASSPSNQQTPPPTPVPVQTASKDASSLQQTDTPAIHPTRKRLSYETTEDEQDSDQEQRKKSKDAPNAAFERLSEHERKTSKKGGEYKAPYAQKNK